jgi:bifunctional non-homologous end joining protein LigD
MEVMPVTIPRAGNATLKVTGKEVRLTNLDKLFWPERNITKGDLIQYYADVAPLLLPHIKDRAMVMKRYPHGAAGAFFFMKRASTTCHRCCG